MHGASLAHGRAGTLLHHLSKYLVRSVSSADGLAMITVSRDQSVLIGERSLHTFSDGLLTIVKMAETSDHLGLVEVVSDDLSPAHLRHASEVGHQLLLVGGSSLRHLRLTQPVKLKLGQLHRHGGSEASLALLSQAILHERFHLIYLIIMAPDIIYKYIIQIKAELCPT